MGSLIKAFIILWVLLTLLNHSYAQVTQEWAARYNGAGNNTDQAYSVDVDDSGNVYVTGSSWVSGNDIDYVTIKYNPSGVQQWVKMYNGVGNGYDVARSVAVDDSGNVYVTGESPGSGTDYDYATIKYSSSGCRYMGSKI